MPYQPNDDTLNEIKDRPRIGLARTLARNLLKETGLKDPPISLWRVINYLKEKNNLTVEPVFDFGEKVSGVLIVFEDSAVIGFNKKQSWYRNRFTLGHEIGHLLMSTTCDSLDDALASNKAGEIAANEFAAELLMPLKVFKADFKRGIQNIDVLSDRYKVSKEAAGWRVVHAGVLK